MSTAESVEEDKHSRLWSQSAVSVAAGVALQVLLHKLVLRATTVCPEVAVKEHQMDWTHIHAVDQGLVDAREAGPAATHRSIERH